jgi:hypothetical protein
LKRIYLRVFTVRPHLCRMFFTISNNVDFIGNAKWYIIATRGCCLLTSGTFAPNH